jgi:NADH-quinone oxidoreductase subunit H
MTTLVTILLIAVVMGGILTLCAYLILLERKVAAWVQERHGPNRVGPWGLLQPLADGAKFFLKEQAVPGHVNKVLYFVAPAISMFTTMLAFAVVPYGPTRPGQESAADLRFILAPNIDIGILFIFSVTSLAVYSIILGGWASNNKYSFLGSLRSSAQLVSYEIPLGLSVLGVVLLTGSLNLERIVARQADEGLFGWNIWFQPLAWLVFLASAMAESNRLPFDLPECEQELVGGYHTEYSAWKFMLFFVGEYTHVVTTSFLMAILFLGGWQFPWIAEPSSDYFGATMVKVLVLLAKVAFFILLIMFIRWTLPRFRFDQLMGMAWKVLIPLTLLNLVATMVVKQYGLSPWWLLAASLLLFVAAGWAATLMPQPVPRRMVARYVEGGVELIREEAS